MTQISGAMKCENCTHLTLDGRFTRCSHVGYMSGVALLRECRLFEAKGKPPPHPSRLEGEPGVEELPW